MWRLFTDEMGDHWKSCGQPAAKREKSQAGISVFLLCLCVISFCLCVTLLGFCVTQWMWGAADGQSVFCGFAC
jgi:hypothetical protein